ncbi:MAG: ABC transporter permease [Pirellulales bacterium]|nr:ABC transporter permease [Pirellulales bacterium]
MPEAVSSTPRPPTRRFRWEARDIAPLVSLLVLVAFFSMVEPSFRRTSVWGAIFDQGAALALVAAGLTFVLIAAEIDLAVGNLAVWTSCFCAWLFTREFAAGAQAERPVGSLLLVGILLAPLLTAVLLGMASGMLTVWSRLPSFIITLAMLNIAMGMSKFLTHNQTLAVPPVLHALGNGRLMLGGWSIPYGVLLAAGVLVVGHLVLRHTRFGRYVYMCGGNREAARLSGVRTGSVVVGCLAVSAFCAGLGGLVNAGRLQSASVLLNQNLLLNAVACVVLGGTSLFGGEGGMGRTVIGVLTFRVLEVGLQRIQWIDEDARILLTGVVLLVALVINGLLAKRSS